MNSSKHHPLSLPTSLVPIYADSLDQDPPAFCRDSSPELILIDLKHVTELLPVLWFRKLRAQMLLYNKVLVGACNPGICLEHAKSAAVPIIETQHMYAQPQEEAKPEIHTPQPTHACTEFKITTLVHQGHVRGGQTICHPDGDVIIVGNLHHGAEIMAGGHVHVLGALAGRALAGTQLGTEALITAFSLNAQLISIAGYYLSSDEIPAQNKPVTVMLLGHDLVIKSHEPH